MIFGNNKTCPFCRKKINKNSVKCKFCNRTLIEIYDNKATVVKEKKNSIKSMGNFNKKVKQVFTIFTQKNKSKIETVFIIFLLLALTTYGATRNLPPDTISNLFKNPCDTTKYYSIGSIDPRFYISKDEVINIANNSVEKWNSVIGKSLLKYKADSEFKVNLVFDYRQEKLNSLRSQKLTMDKIKLNLDRDKENYESDLDSYNQDVDYWNNNGGAEWGVRSDLDQRRDDLNSTQNNLDSRIDEYNGMVEEYNSMLNPNKSEDIVGEFVPNTISIFSFENNNQLLSILTHEFGHSLGLKHEETDTNAIMYKISDFNKFVKTDLQPTDMTAIKSRCKMQ
jgi:hypothetical protein